MARKWKELRLGRGPEPTARGKGPRDLSDLSGPRAADRREVPALVIMARQANAREEYAETPIPVALHDPPAWILGA